MRVSICIPQYNRIEYLIKSLEIISSQTHNDIEIIISDDCSTDDTKFQIEQLQKNYKFPLIYHRFVTNQGYDRNLRKSLELASGYYCFVLGNDDTLSNPNAISKLCDFLQLNNYPDLGFCNYVEECNIKRPSVRAHDSVVLGSGAIIALKYYSCFSFVAGLIFKRTTFLKYNTNEYDGSIYAQIALAVKMIASGEILFSINDCLVIKDIRIGNDLNQSSNSYRDTLIRKWNNFKIVDGGLHSVIKILALVFTQTNSINDFILVSIYRKIYRTTYPFWIFDYKKNNALPNAIGLVIGLLPWKNTSFKNLMWYSKFEIIITYIVTTLFSLLLPSFLVFKFKNQLYSLIKR